MLFYSSTMYVSLKSLPSLLYFSYKACNLYQNGRFQFRSFLYNYLEFHKNLWFEFIQVW